MPSAKQIKARKLFAKRVKRGDFRKAISKTKKSNFDKDYEMVCHTCGKKGDLSKHNKRHKIGSQARSYSVGAEETAKAMGQQTKKSVINISELIINSSQDIKLKLKSYTLDELFQLTHDIDTELLAMYRNNQQNNYDKTIELLKKRRKIVESLVQQQLK